MNKTEQAKCKSNCNSGDFVEFCSEKSAYEMAAECFCRIKKSKTNAVLWTREQDALAEARQLDELRKNGQIRGRLHGLPVLIKDNIDVEGLPTTCGSLALKDNIAVADAECVRRLKDAGAVILGKTNMDEFAMGSSNTTSAFGRVLNPVCHSKVPGGSSGGSAAAVAGGLCFAALGSDTGGSIRQPASYCGVVGLKPTFGAVDSHGCFPLAPTMDMIGPIARNISDLAAVFSVLSGRDYQVGGDCAAAESVIAGATQSGAAQSGTLFGGLQERATGLAGLRIGVIAEAEATGEALVVLDRAKTLLLAAGCQLVPLSVPLFSDAAGIYRSLAFSEITRSLSSVAEGRELFGAEVKKRILAGRYVLNHPRLMAEAARIRAELTVQMRAAAGEVDAIILPVAPSVAFGFDDDPKTDSIKNSDMFVQPASIAGLPSLSLPFLSLAGLPMGLQLVGDINSEQTLFNIAYYIEKIENLA